MFGAHMLVESLLC